MYNGKLLSHHWAISYLQSLPWPVCAASGVKPQAAPCKTASLIVWKSDPTGLAAT